MTSAPDVLRSLADDTARVAAQEFARSVVHRLLGPRTKARKDGDGELARKVDEVLRTIDRGRLGRQVAEAATWARIIHVHGMPIPVDTGTATVPLDMATVQRRFRSAERPDDVYSEAELFSATGSFLLLGDPGSGKTTTLKRLTLAMFDEISSDAVADLALPIVLVCREIDWRSASLPELVAERCGVDLGRLRSDLQAPKSERIGLTGELMDRAKCLLIVDGLDEVAPKYRSMLLADLERLNRVLAVARIVCSSRSGNEPHLEGFLTLELLPLTAHQRAEIVSLRLGEESGFFERLGQSGIDSELMDRPLFLNHLVRVFEATGAVAARPSDLYGQLVRLMIHEWDEQRRVHRRSAIKGLDAITVEALLSEIAFQLTSAGLALFDDRDLQRIVEEIGPRYELADSNGRRVIRELQSYAGFVVETPSGFEFTHLTLQEHLCAANVVQRPSHKSVERLLRQNPEVAAVAVALSSHPTDWLLERIGPTLFETSRQVSAFVQRVGLERPRFIESQDLGTRLLQLMSRCTPEQAGPWHRLASLPAARASVGRALQPYHVIVRGDVAEVARRREDELRDARRVPRYKVPSALLDPFVSAPGA